MIPVISHNFIIRPADKGILQNLWFCSSPVDPVPVLFYSLEQPPVPGLHFLISCFSASPALHHINPISVTLQENRIIRLSLISSPDGTYSNIIPAHFPVCLSHRMQRARDFRSDHTTPHSDPAGGIEFHCPTDPPPPPALIPQSLLRCGRCPERDNQEVPHKPQCIPFRG